MKSLLDALRDGRLVELPENDKPKALRFLAHLIEAIPELGSGVNVADEVLAREATMNTAIGLGIACPHVRGKAAGELLCAVGWSPSGIDYGARDGQKVHLVVMYFIPDDQKNVYLREVSSLAAEVKKEGGIQAIAKAEDLATVRAELLDWVSAALEAGVPQTRARMVLLEARQAAAEAPATAAPGELEILALSILESGDRLTVLSESEPLAAAVERLANLAVHLKEGSQFEEAGYRLVFQKVTRYGLRRTLWDFLAIRPRPS